VVAVVFAVTRLSALAEEDYLRYESSERIKKQKLGRKEQRERAGTGGESLTLRRRHGCSKWSSAGGGASVTHLACVILFE
jgi:hypothetical protein